MCWELNMGPLEEQPMLSSWESSSQAYVDTDWWIPQLLDIRVPLPLAVSVVLPLTRARQHWCERALPGPLIRHWGVECWAFWWPPFELSRIHHISHSGCSIWFQYTGLLMSSHPGYHSLFVWCVRFLLFIMGVKFVSLLLGFVFCFLLANDIWHFFMCFLPFVHVHVFFREMFIKVLCPVFHWVVYLFIMKIKHSLKAYFGL